MENEKQKAEKTQKDYEAMMNYNSRIRHHLEQFLQASANVDFNAQLIKNGKYMIFANPAYEHKPEEWKVYYRCGREAVSGARKFAQDWLAKLK